MLAFTSAFSLLSSVGFSRGWHVTAQQSMSGSRSAMCGGAWGWWCWFSNLGYWDEQVMVLPSWSWATWCLTLKPWAGGICSSLYTGMAVHSLSNWKPIACLCKLVCIPHSGSNDACVVYCSIKYIYNCMHFLHIHMNMHIHVFCMCTYTHISTCVVYTWNPLWHSRRILHPCPSPCAPKMQCEVPFYNECPWFLFGEL